MIRRIKVELSGPPRRIDSDHDPLRILAVSDEVEHAFDYQRNVDALRPIDAIMGAGDLRPDYLDFLTGVFNAPLFYVRGNHDRGGGWEEGLEHVPVPIDGSWHDVGSLVVAGLSWPSDSRGRAIHDDNLAWRQVATCFMKIRGRQPDIIVSHVPPQGLGDTPEDHYHRGFAAYRWLCERLKPSLWIHGHTSLASTEQWQVRHGPTTIVNATGAVVIDISPAIGAQTAIPGVGATIEAQ